MSPTFGPSLLGATSVVYRPLPVLVMAFVFCYAERGFCRGGDDL